MKKLILLILLQYLYAVVFSANTFYYSIVNGNWNAGTTWSSTSGGASCNCNPGTQPGSSDYQYIQTDVSLNIATLKEKGYIEISANKSLYTTVNNVEIQSTGTLIVYGTLEVNNLVFYNGSKITVHPGGKIIVHGNFTNNNNSDNVIINGSITVSGVFDNGNGGVVSGSGVISASSYTGNGTTFGYTNSDIPAGSSVSQGSLPVNLIYFNANVVQSKVYIQWTTASEINNNYFEIQRSEDAINFHTIAKIYGAGNSNSIINYEYIDEISPESNVYYYRLHQVDFNGDNSTSEIISVEIDKIFNDFIRIGNSENYIILLFSTPISGEIKVKMFDNGGRLVLQQIENTNQNSSIKINKQSIKNGFYTLVVNNGNEVMVKKVVVIH